MTKLEEEIRESFLNGNRQWARDAIAYKNAELNNSVTTARIEV